MKKSTPTKPSNDRTKASEQKQVGELVSVERYKQGRYWSVWVDGQLLAVTVYKRGAMAVKAALSMAK